MNRAAGIGALFLLGTGIWAAADPPEASLQVVVRLPPGTTGEVRVALCSSLSQFLDQEPPMAQAASPAADAVARLPFTDLPPGFYALKAYLDLNGNRKLDRDWLGRPREPWAISNGIRAKPDRASWEGARFRLQRSADPAPSQLILDLEL